MINPPCIRPEKNSKCSIFGCYERLAFPDSVSCCGCKSETKQSGGDHLIACPALDFHGSMAIEDDSLQQLAGLCYFMSLPNTLHAQPWEARSKYLLLFYFEEWRWRDPGSFQGAESSKDPENRHPTLDSRKGSLVLSSTGCRSAYKCGVLVRMAGQKQVSSPSIVQLTNGPSTSQNHPARGAATDAAETPS